MSVSIELAALRGTRWHQYALRFVLGGLVTAAAGVIASYLGPVIGGLFLAFPAIFPASATLIAARERKKKARKGFNGAQRGSRAAALDAAGAVLGAIGLIGFAWLLWKELPRHGASAFFYAAVLWIAVATALWWLRKRRWRAL